MANTIRIKRRATGAVGAPVALANAELAFNEVDNTLYYGKGTGGAGGTATTIDAIGGSGAFSSLTANQTISGNKTYTGTLNAITQTITDNSTLVATTAYVKGQNYLTTVVGTTPVSASVSGNTATVSMSAATTSVNGYLTSTDWTTFNGKISANQSITVSGDATGSGNTAITLTLASVGTAGTYTKVTTDAKGRITSGTTLSATDIPTLAASKISDFDTQVRTNRLDQMTAPSAAVSFNSQKITGLADPTAAQDAATKQYVDATRQGLSVKDAVRAATTADIALSGTQTVDGVSLNAGDRVLVKNQTIGANNGLYIVVSANPWTRTTDSDAPTGELSGGTFVFIQEGTVNADSGWVCTNDGTVTVGTTALTFTQFSGAGQITTGAGLTKTGNTIDVIGTTNRITANADSIDIASTYVGQTSITTLGTIAAGTWNGTTIAVANGGTGATTLTGLVKGNGTSAFTAAVDGTDYLSPTATIDGGTF
jgi:hypothetical protein